MLEDKLQAAERIRLEALSQAVLSSGAAAERVVAGGDILRRAKMFEDYIITGDVPR